MTAPHLHHSARITVLMTAHNRVAVTRRCLELLDRASDHADVVLSRIVVDDGSTDGTWELLQQARRSSDVMVSGDGNLFWAGGMREAMRHLDNSPSFDHVLLLNDDAVLRADALTTLLAATRQDGRHLVVGTFLDPTSGQFTYGGYLRRSRLRPLTFDAVHNRPGALVDAMNANAVLVGAAAYRELGSFDPAYTHCLADFDYALRARRLGLPVVLSDAPVGECASNRVAGSWRDTTLGRRERVRRMCSPKGLPPKEWARFCWRHGGVAGLPYVLTPWAKLLLPLRQLGM